MTLLVSNADSTLFASTKAVSNASVVHIASIVMGASFRNTEEIIELAGCDKLTIAPKLLDELSLSTSDVSEKLNASKAKDMVIPKIEITESKFRWMMNEDAMATEKLAEGIRGFTQDILKLESIVQAKMDATAKRRKISNDD